ncbi:hypothetical protein TcG_13498, partial [Trypanosoma cruzi]
YRYYDSGSKKQERKYRRLENVDLMFVLLFMTVYFDYMIRWVWYVVGLVVYKVGVENAKWWFWEGRSNLGPEFHASPPYIIWVETVDFTGRWGSIGVGVI